MKKMTAKKKPTKRNPREWEGWSWMKVGGRRPFVTWVDDRTLATARNLTLPGEVVMRVRITEIVK